MKTLMTVVLLVLLVPATLAQTRGSRGVPARRISKTVSEQSAQVLPLRRVVLYSNGVAYFERRGTVTGHAEIALSFKQSQVDDVLKSMVVLDLGQGRIGAVSYNSSEPTSSRLSEIPFSMEASSSSDGEESSGGLAGVLGQLQGARVLVTTAAQTITGAILNVENRKIEGLQNKPPQVSHVLVLNSDGGQLTSVDLSEVRSLKLLDEGAVHDVTEFANASASARRRDAKTIVVTSDGNGPREMVISYTVAAPVWKTTYRVVLDEAGKPFFQGWAIVDNVSDEDWRDVSLSLISGSPVSFVQPLQQPFYRHRPVMGLPEGLQLEPQVYAEGIAGGVPGGMIEARQVKALALPDRNPVDLARLQAGVARGKGSGTGAGAGVGTGRQGLNVMDSFVSAGSEFAISSPAPNTALSGAMTSGSSGVEAAASGSDIGDLFEYHIDQPVTVPRDHSALIPILQTRLEGERVSIYSESVLRDRPLSGVRLKNTSNLTLESGALTVLDENTYAGEALIARLKPGETRLISFALDLGTLVTTKTKADRTPSFFVRAIKGIFEAHYFQTEKKTYTISNQTDKPRVIYVQHPIRKDWELSDDTPKPESVTAAEYRFKIETPPHSTTQLVVGEQRALKDQYTITELTKQEFDAFVSSNYLDETARAVFEKILDLKIQIESAQKRIADADAEIAKIGDDQDRLRENIKALKDTSEARQLIARYVAKASEQETRIEELTKQRKSDSEALTRLEQSLASTIRSLSFDRKLAK